MSQPGESNPVNRAHNLSFMKKESRPGVTTYIFNKVSIFVDTTGTNYKDLPELLFGTFDENTVDGEDNELEKSSTRREGVDMEYVRECLGKVANESGIHKFWFNSYDEDGHGEARVRLFRRFFSITPEANGYGHIIEI